MFIRDTTPVPPLALVLFGGALQVGEVDFPQPGADAVIVVGPGGICFYVTQTPYCMLNSPIFVMLALCPIIPNYPDLFSQDAQVICRKIPKNSACTQKTTKKKSRKRPKSRETA